MPGKDQHQKMPGSPRGSSAIFDSASCVLVLAKKTDDSVQVIQTKTRNVRFAGISFCLEDVGEYVPQIGQKQGLRFETFEEQPTAPDQAERIVQALEAAPNNMLQASDLWGEVLGNKARYLKARKQLEKDCVIACQRRGRENWYVLLDEPKTKTLDTVSKRSSL